MSREKTTGRNPGKKRKYSKPKIRRHGSLQGIAERVTGTVLMCCLTRRAKAALHSPYEKRRLLEDVGRSLALAPALSR